MAEENKQTLKTMEKHNNNLGILLGHRKRITSLRAPKSFALAGKYQCVRRDAIKLHKAMTKGLTSNCNCAASHTASLRLETRYLIRLTKGVLGEEILQDLSFNVLLSFETKPSDSQNPPWLWRETCFEPVFNPSLPSEAVNLADKSLDTQPPRPPKSSLELPASSTVQAEIKYGVNRQSGIR